MKKSILLSFILFFSTCFMQAATIYLVDNSATSGPAGSGWRIAGAGEINVHLEATAFNVWYSGITFEADDQVWLLSDVNKYILTAPVVLKADGKIYGGFYGTETNSTLGDVNGRQLNSNPAGNWDLKYPSILDGAGASKGITGGDATVIIDGLTVQNCMLTGAVAASTAAGIQVNSGTLVQNCIVTACTSNCTSGSIGNAAASGIALSSGAKLFDSYIHDNTMTFTSPGSSTGNGGGAVSIMGNATNYSFAIVTPAISGCKITNNTSNAGVLAGGLLLYNSVGNSNYGFKNVQVLNCTISNNTTTGSGGGIAIFYGTTVNNPSNAYPLVITGCTISGNVAKSTIGGGGLYFLNNNTSYTNNNVTIQNCTFTNNIASSSGLADATAGYNGSAIYARGIMTMNNCIMASNFGANVVFAYPANGLFVNINNCTIANNFNATSTAVKGFYSNTPLTASAITNTIFYNQTSTPIDINGGTVYPTTTYCGFESTIDLTVAPYNSAGNINSIAADSFVGTNDYHLVAGSAATDAGTAIAACSLDLDNISRPQGTNYCMGAYELPQSKFYFRSVTTGDWSNSASWQMSPKTTWISATSAPTSNAASVDIRNGHLITITENATSPTLTVNGGGQLTLNNGTTLGITGNFAINSDIDNGTGTLKNNGTLTVSGSTKVQQYLTNQTWYLTSPVWDGVNPENSITPTNLSRIQSYMEGSGTGNIWSTSGTTMQPYKGYITTVSDNLETVEFTGKINSGDISIPLTRFSASTANKYGFNLIGNPYTAYLDWKEVATANASKMPTSTMWYRTNVSGSWAFSTVDGLGNKVPANVSDLIPPMQAFWVRASTVGNSTLDLTTTMLAHDIASDNKLKAPATTASERTKVRLQVSNATETDELLIYTDAHASNSFDWYDSPKMSNADANIPEISTVVGCENLAINGLNSLILDTELPIRYMTKTANAFTLKVNELSNLPEGIKVILKDNGIEFDLTNGQEYNFSSDVADNTNRFCLIFRAPGFTTDLNSDKLKSQTLAFTNANNQITIIAPEKSSYAIYNAVGQLIESGILNTKYETRNNKLTAGMYIVKVNNLSTRVTIK